MEVGLRAALLVLAAVVVTGATLHSCGKEKDGTEPQSLDAAPGTDGDSPAPGPAGPDPNAPLGTWKSVETLQGPAATAKRLSGAWFSEGKLLVPTEKGKLNRLDIATDTWSESAAIPDVVACYYATEVQGAVVMLCGSEVFAYDLAADAWTPKGSVDAMNTGGILAFGRELGLLSRSGILDRAFDLENGTTRKLPELKTVAGRTGMITSACGNVIYAWGGVTYNNGKYALPREGYQLDAGTDGGSWRPMATDAAPVGRKDHVQLCIGESLFVWGGNGVMGADDGGDELYRKSGAIYDPVKNAWSAVEPAALTGRAGAAAAWSGTKVYVWGGGTLFAKAVDGAAFDVAEGKWRPLAASGAPAGRERAAGIWTDAGFVVWGGSDAGKDQNDGGVLQ